MTPSQRVKGESTDAPHKAKERSTELAHDPMTVAEAADAAGVCPKTVYRAIARGDLLHFRRHRQQGIGVWSCDLRKWIEKRKS